MACSQGFQITKIHYYDKNRLENWKSLSKKVFMNMKLNVTSTKQF